MGPHSKASAKPPELSFESNFNIQLGENLHHLRPPRPPIPATVLLFIMPPYGQFHSSGKTPLRAYNRQPVYDTYKSPYGPAYKHQPNIMGLTFQKAVRYGSIASGFAVAGGIFALFFFGDVPRVRKDILSHLPVIGEYFIKEVAPEDDPF